MNRLSRGNYYLIDGVIYRVFGRSESNNRNWVLRAVDPAAEPAQWEIPAGTPGYKRIEPSATYRGVLLTELIFQGDGRVLFTVWPYPHDWPVDVPLTRYGMPERGGDGWWSGVISFSELADFDDGFPQEWRSFLPTDAIDYGK
ncbi:hypothetical protein [Streptomyces sp. ITFR-16]|uniref:hypothetical protein n=1 Tax=Streptomyces sp. ITFR-16 TaxID=3075198 RepID=UPI00288BB0F2|nr:hypothetical protein [Streptomyces sp. ITFR-16]WNI26735.1 hypothetical protein RLT58_34825 [Streptomyces sp. ITFR-16]